MSVTALKVLSDKRTKELAEECVKALELAGMHIDAEKAKELIAEVLRHR